jgi:lipoic acid synthetase
VERLQKPVRVQARYDRSRSVLQHAKARGFTTKTGIMLGLGEREEEIEQTLRDIAADKTDILTIGQYLQPTPQHWKIARWVHPDEFAEWKAFALAAGSRDAALIVSLAPGAYTVQITSADGTATGVALIELYELP